MLIILILFFVLVIGVAVLDSVLKERELKRREANLQKALAHLNSNFKTEHIYDKL